MRCYFDLHDGDHWAKDDFGVECESLDYARWQAILALTEMAHEYMTLRQGPSVLFVRIRSDGIEPMTYQLALTVARG